MSNTVLAVIAAWGSGIAGFAAWAKSQAKKDEAAAVAFANALEQKVSTILTAIQKITPPTPPAADKK